MLGDWEKFSCQACAAAPNIPKIIGCFTEVPHVVAHYADFQFFDCPVRYRSAPAVILSGLGAEGFLKQLGVVAARKLPAKRRAALEYIEEYLIKLKLAQ